MLYTNVLFSVLIIYLSLFKCMSYRCDRIPLDLLDQPKTNIGQYLLEINGKPESYVPNEKYEIIIKVDSYIYSHYKFRKFIITLESKASADDGDEITYQTGSFELGDDALSKFSDTCKDTVVEANTQPKKQVKLIWNAPPPSSGCVSIRATVIETREKWYADLESSSDGFLTKTLCEDLNDNEDVLPEVQNFCCACDEAKYEVAFQGNWIRNTHPRGFPQDLWTTKFGDIIGASHKINHHFWSDGSEPSSGLKELAFNGSTKTLESELMGNIANLRTIIKARGLAYPNITSLSYAIFRVDNENHLVSLATKMMPSPDWIVGVSNMELCLSNCSWKQFRIVNLYPKDVGIDDGLYYTDRKPSTNENPIVREISSSEPADPKSPFYDESGEKMKPIAKLHFKLEKVYKKECDPNRQPSEEKQEEEVKPYGSEEKTTNKDCEYSKWSSCSVACGKGHMTRNLIFRHNSAPGRCLREETHECEAPCEEGEEYMEICPSIDWESWSPCNVTCGKGIKKRYRKRTRIWEEDNQQCANINKELVECYEEDC